ncbi:MAG: cysteine--tRNA ligase [Cyclonatronaceae bacterium]
MKQLQIYNTLTRKTELFEPVTEGFAGIYVCGPTVYGDAHLGHAKSYVTFDIVVRYLRYIGFRVRYVQNITDVGHLTDDHDEGEDKLSKQSRLEKLEPMEIAEKYTTRYFQDMDSLKLIRPDIVPRASGHIPEQIAIIENLIKKGYAYEVNGNVYFDVTSFLEYGKLSGRKTEDAETGTRVETASDKRNPSDFALWKKADESHIMRWHSPWGEGYPGWHIECSAMSMKYLGSTFDIHGGGLENQFPHHECEIAQSESHTGKPFVRYWMHNNMVTLNGQKMGKSLGNAISLRQFFDGEHKLLSRAWSPAVIRFFLLQSHYRSTTDFSEKALEGAEAGYKALSEILKSIEDAGSEGSSGSNDFDLEALSSAAEAAMNDDFNTARAIGVLFERLRPLRHALQQGDIPANITDVFHWLFRFTDEVLGIWPGESFGGKDQLADGLINLLLEMRAEARDQKNWALSDQIRDRLKKLNVTIEDTAAGQKYSIQT